MAGVVMVVSPPTVAIPAGKYHTMIILVCCFHLLSSHDHPFLIFFYFFTSDHPFQFSFLFFVATVVVAMADGVDTPPATLPSAMVDMVAAASNPVPLAPVEPSATLVAVARSPTLAVALDLAAIKQLAS